MTTSLLIDLVVVVVCTGVLIGSGRLSMSHPATIYLGFHVLVVTWRIAALANGAEPLFRWGPRYEAITASEVQRAATIADVVLVAMTMGFLWAAAKDRKRFPDQRKRMDLAVQAPPSLSLRHIEQVVKFTLPVGALSLVLFSAFPGRGVAVDTGTGALSSGWVFITTSWFGLSLLALIYWHGFRLRFMVPMCLYLAVMMLQGGLRFRFVIPVVLLILIAVDRAGRKWPTKQLVGVLILVVVTFFPLKAIGRQIQSGGGLAGLGETTSESVGSALRGQNGDQVIFDELASTLTLVDRQDRFYYGSVYGALLTLPIPRQVWPGKPGLADHLQDISTRSRPMAETGMVTTFMGEAYMNFWYPGVVLVPLFVALLLGTFYFRAYEGHYRSINRFLFLIVACSLIQVYRDGLISLVFFVVVQMMPLSMIVSLHRLRPIMTTSPANMHGAIAPAAPRRA